MKENFLKEKEQVQSNNRYSLSKSAIAIFIGTLLLLIVYLFGTFYFQTHLLPRSYIGPIAVGNMSAEVADVRLREGLPQSQVIFNEANEDIAYLKLEQLDLEVRDIDHELDQAISTQNAYTWPLALFQKQQVVDNFSDYLIFDSQAIDRLIPELGIQNQHREVTYDAEIIVNGAGIYELRPAVYGNQINDYSLEQALAVSIEKNNLSFNLEEAYIQPEIVETDERIVEQIATINKMQSSQITLEFAGNAIMLPQEEIASWIFLTEDGNPELDIEAIEDYILEDINRPYASLFQGREFSSTYQGLVWVEPGTYGWYIDRFLEAELIAEDLIAGRQVTREPVMGGSGYGQEDEIGSNYVEVDIANQMMTIYLDYDIVLQTPVVTGQVGTNTIPGAFQVWEMETPSVLRGYNPHYESDYAQPVEYWIAFDDQAQGIHDADWQPYFGGDAYLTNGSLGCINTPPGVMPQVFEIVYNGMPVVVF